MLSKNFRCVSTSRSSIFRICLIGIGTLFLGVIINFYFGGRSFDWLKDSRVIRPWTKYYAKGPRSRFFAETTNASGDGNLNRSHAPLQDNSITILFWTKYYQKAPRFYINQFADKKGDGESSIRCPTVKECKIIYNQSLLNVSDGVVFHTRALHFMSMKNGFSLPIRPNNTQPWILFHRESPLYTQLNFRRFPNIFNWTMSYRTDSDIYYPYGKLIPIDSKTIHERSSYSPDIRAKKTGKVAWTVSHCKVKSKREELMKKLSQFIEIHVYGKCGDHKCNFPNNDDGCSQQLKDSYKFYLSFENSLCQQYVTEKFYNALNSSLIPVVYGYGPYETIAPAGSYINVRSFSTIQDLGEHLNYLDENPMEYAKYFEWKKHFQVNQDNDKDAWCDLCDKLLKNRVDKNRNYQWYSDLHLWFNSRVSKSTDRPYLQYIGNSSNGPNGSVSDEHIKNVYENPKGAGSVCIPPFVKEDFRRRGM